MTITLERDAYTERLEELRRTTERPVREFVHEDSSHTFVVYDDDPGHANPRDDENVARLVMKHRDYRNLDEPDNGIDDARSRWGEESPLVTRYVAMFRPDIAHYEPRWEVSGSTQGDWAYGYGYVLVEDAERIAVTPDPKYTHDYNRAHPESRRFREVAKKALDQEVTVYGLYFAGEVFGGFHIKRGKPIVTYGEHGAYVDGYEADEEAVWGFLGYDNLRDICGEFTASPVAEEAWL